MPKLKMLDKNKSLRQVVGRVRFGLFENLVLPLTKFFPHRCWDQCAGPMTLFFPPPKCNVAVETPTCSAATVCVDAINTCGMRYGGYVQLTTDCCLRSVFANGSESCYNTCDGPFTQQVTAPTCPTTVSGKTTHSHHANTTSHSSKKLTATSTVAASYSPTTGAAMLQDLATEIT